MVQATEEVKIDTNLYSRQIGTFGMETMGKLIKMKVLIIGCRGLGVETAKNLILAGPGSVDLYDPTTVTVDNLGSNFYLNQEHVGKTTRAEGCVGQLKELNPYVKVNVVTSATADDMKNYNCVVVTENFVGINALQDMNDACRESRTGFILTETLGAAGYIFLDYGKDFLITDENGEQTKSFIVTHISQEEHGQVTVHEDKRHSYADGDYVKFVEVEGMSEINNREPIEIFDCRPFSFKLKLDTTKFNLYSGQGTVEDVKVPKKTSYHSLRESIRNPAASTAYGMLEPINMSHFGMQRSEQIHVAIGAVHKFREVNGRYPSDNAEDVAAAIGFAKELNAASKAAELPSLEEVDEDIVRKVAAYSTSSISPLCAFFGGIVAQEIVKYTGKYTPLKQWLHYDTFESIPDGEVDRRPLGGRYDDQIKIYGREVQEKLGAVNTFMVGAGALGCEYAKAFALMGIGCGPTGSVAVTDNDNIEVSNLNRQFLFRKNNVGKPKSETACQIAKIMNPDLTIRPMTDLVGPDTEHIFNDKFWGDLNFVVNAVDNIKARLYVDQMCVWYEKPLLESGTLGTKANSQMIVPRVTTCYGDSQDPPEESIPLCTLRSFPNLIEHCIEWGRAKFEGYFTQRAMDSIDLLKDQEGWLADSRKASTSTGVKDQLRGIKDFIQMKNNASMQLCINEARAIFDELYDHDIRDLLSLLPPDHTTSAGNPFWSGPKRCPDPISFNVDDETHFSFIFNTANLIAVNLGLQPERDVAKVKELVSQAPAKPYVKKNVVVETPEEAKEREAAGRPAPVASSDEDDEAIITELMGILKISTEGVKESDIVPADFEKDDDENFHIDFITACSNLRATNYRITTCDRNKTKMIAGKIIPAIATTTAMITGAVCTELFKFVQGMNTIGKFKNSFINLALPSVMFTEPDDVKKIVSKDYDPILAGPVEAVPAEYTIFDKTVVKNGSMTVQQFIDWMDTNKGVEVQMITCGSAAVYNAYMPSQANRLGQKIEDLYKNISQKELTVGRDYLILESGGVVKASGSDYQMPPIQYFFK